MVRGLSQYCVCLSSMLQGSFRVPSLLESLSWAGCVATGQPCGGIAGRHQAVQRMQRGVLTLRCRSSDALALTRQGCRRHPSSSGLGTSVYDMCLVVILTDFLGIGR